jgi:hypothetical protein
MDEWMNSSGIGLFVERRPSWQAQLISLYLCSLAVLRMVYVV